MQLVRVAALEGQAAARTGIETLLEAPGDLVFVGAAADERSLRRLLQHRRPDVLLLDHPRHPARCTSACA